MIISHVQNTFGCIDNIDKKKNKSWKFLAITSFTQYTTWM